jgi:hypothetical protein
MILPVVAVQAPPAPQQGPMAFLILLEGEWIGEGTGQPGEGTGGCTFRFELGGKAFVRRNWADYPATKERPAFRHDDLLVGSATPAGVRAVYWDSEGHRIDYTVSSPEPGVAGFLGDTQAGAPRLRLTYRMSGKDALSLVFDIAPPGQSEAFKPYIQAKLRRK